MSAAGPLLLARQRCRKRISENELTSRSKRQLIEHIEAFKDLTQILRVQRMYLLNQASIRSGFWPK